MNLKTIIFTNNNCYKDGKIMSSLKGILVHSTGANNPKLARYVPDADGTIGTNAYGNHWDQPKPGGISVCVHGFIGKLADGSIATVQSLPWTMRGWHAGKGSKGTANDNYIGFEICEDNLTDSVYFNAVYKEAVELCTYLCKEYNLDPKNIICHSEAHTMGIASNHADVMHWFPKFGKSMDTFRKDVTNLLKEPETPEESTKGKLYRVQVGAFSIKANATNLANQLKTLGFDTIIKEEEIGTEDSIPSKPKAKKTPAKKSSTKKTK